MSATELPPFDPEIEEINQAHKVLRAKVSTATSGRIRLAAITANTACWIEPITC